MNLREMARRLDGEVSGGRVSAPGPGHRKGDRSMRVWIEQGRLCVTSFANDEWGVCMDHARSRLGLPPFDPARQEQEPRYQVHDNPEIDKAAAEQRAKLAARIWHTAMPLAGTLAESYLAARQLPLPANADRVLRFHPETPRKAKRQPALIARFSPICGGDDAPVSAILRIFLRPDASGHDGKMCLGTPFTEATKLLFQAIKLSPDWEVDQGLHLSEGVETGLACMAAGLKPLWATFATPGLATFPLLHGIECLNVMADHDENGAGLKAASAVAERYQRAGTHARIILAEKPGTDWADRWIEYRKMGK